MTKEIQCGPNHLLRIESDKEPTRIKDDLPDAHLFRVEIVPVELAEIAQFLQEGKAWEGYSKKNKILTIKASHFTLINGSLYKLGLDDIPPWCVLEHERHEIIGEEHSISIDGHFQADTTIKKIIQSSLWWPSINKDCKN